MNKQYIPGFLKNKLLFATTIIPTIISILYYGFVASDVYISESRFVVRSQEKQATSPLGMILKSTGFSKSQDDSYTVQDYILSRDALAQLEIDLKVRESFSSDGVDVFSRFGGAFSDTSFESLYLYYQKKVGVQLETSSAITTLTVKSFNQDDAFKINTRLLELAENLVNKLNERGRQDMISYSLKEVEESREKAKYAALALASYRDTKGVVDPEKQTAIPLQQIAKMQDELIATKTQLVQLKSIAASNPQIPVWTKRAELIENEILAETKRIAGGERSLTAKAVDYQRLILEKEFSDRMLASAMNSLEQAKSEAQRKQLYLEKVVSPNKPDYPVEPKRFRGILTTLVLGLIIWGVLSILLYGVREHRD